MDDEKKPRYDWTDYVLGLEQRVAELEQELERLRAERYAGGPTPTTQS